MTGASGRSRSHVPAKVVQLKYATREGSVLSECDDKVIEGDGSGGYVSFCLKNLP
jgi:hypothetical protein